MKTWTMSLLRIPAMVILLAGCTFLLPEDQVSPENQPDDKECAGTSIGCGNPPIAELETTELNACDGVSCSGALSPFPYSVKIGDVIDFNFRHTAEIPSPEIHFRIYPVNRIPHFPNAPLDSFVVTDSNSFRLLPGDLLKSIEENRGATASDSDYFVFNIHILLLQRMGSVVYRDEGLVSEIALNVKTQKFVTIWKNPSKRDTLFPPIKRFQGNIAIGTEYESRFAAATSAYIFVPGSPYGARIDLASRHFEIVGLPYGRFEVRMFTLSQNQAAGDTIPVYLMTADPDSSVSRPFRINKVIDTLELPPRFP
ncbi:MAG: hypothetical protein ABI036_07100 [Fibrobacteria bacterium]